MARPYPLMLLWRAYAMTTVVQKKTVCTLLKYRVNGTTVLVYQNLKNYDVRVTVYRLR